MKPVVYVLVDIADRAIYVGSTHDYARRFKEHQRSPMWADVAAAEIYVQPDWELALFVERNLIGLLNPEYNVQSTDPTERFLSQAFGPAFRSLAEVMQ